MPRKETTKQQKDSQELYRAKSPGNFLLFYRGLYIPNAGKPALFGNCVESFQEETFKDLAPSLHALKRGDLPPVRRFWVERTKKASKDADLAICILWLIAFAERPFLVQVCAATQKQAGIIRRRMIDLIHYNPWLQDYVKVQQYRVLSISGLGETIIESTDTAGGAHGETPDLLVLNELVHVAKWATMETHMANATGVPRGMVIVCTNAGIKGTRAWVWRDRAINNPDRWSVHIWNKKAPWVPDDNVEEARRLDPIGGEFKRLWGGLWISGSGDAIDQASIDRCFTMTKPLDDREKGWTYIGGLDLGIKKDHAAVVAVGINTKLQKIKVARFKAFLPSVPNDKGDLEVSGAGVENYCVKLWKIFLIDWFGYDPAAGGSFMAQRLRQHGVPMREYSFANSGNMTDMATCFVKTLKDGKLEAYDDRKRRLSRDFGKLSIEHTPPSSYKLKALSDSEGHADVGIAVIITLPQALERLTFWDGQLMEDDVLWDESFDKEMTAEEVLKMPDEMREVYEGAIPTPQRGFVRFDDDWY